MYLIIDDLNSFIRKRVTVKSNDLISLIFRETFQLTSHIIYLRKQKNRVIFWGNGANNVVQSSKARS